jgi:hypothetical protein
LPTRWEPRPTRAHLGADLVPALARLDVHDLPHGARVCARLLPLPTAAATAARWPQPQTRPPPAPPPPPQPIAARPAPRSGGRRDPTAEGPRARSQPEAPGGMGEISEAPRCCWGVVETRAPDRRWGLRSWSPPPSADQWVDALWDPTGREPGRPRSRVLRLQPLPARRGSGHRVPCEPLVTEDTPPLHAPSSTRPPTRTDLALESFCARGGAPPHPPPLVLLQWRAVRAAVRQVQNWKREGTARIWPHTLVISFFLCGTGASPLSHSTSPFFGEGFFFEIGGSRTVLLGLASNRAPPDLCLLSS